MKREKGKDGNENISQSSGSKPPEGPREALSFFFLGLAPKQDCTDKYWYTRLFARVLVLCKMV